MKKSKREVRDEALISIVYFPLAEGLSSVSSTVSISVLVLVTLPPKVLTPSPEPHGYMHFRSHTCQFLHILKT